MVGTLGRRGRSPLSRRATPSTPWRGSRLLLGVYTGLRRGDAVGVGPQHLRDGVLSVKQQKTGGALRIPMHTDLLAVLGATPSANLAFLTTSFGKPFTSAGFGAWFRERCDEAGLPKHCSFHIMARRDGNGVRLFSRNGHDFTSRFPLLAAAAMALPAHSFLIDGEAIVTDGDGFAVFELIRRQRHGGAAVLCAFDLIELEGEDLRRAAIEHRKQKLSRLVRTPHPGIILNEHYDGDGEIVFKYACKLGCEGIVSKRLGSPYRSGRFAHWVKVKNPNAPAVKREADEGWGDNQ